MKDNEEYPINIWKDAQIKCTVLFALWSIIWYWNESEVGLHVSTHALTSMLSKKGKLHQDKYNMMPKF